MWYDYIKIRDYDGIKSSDAFDPGLFEVFQGVSVSVTPGDGGGGGGEEEPEIDLEKLQQWLDAVNVWIADEEIWLDATVAAANGTRDVPAPMPPKLPELSDFLSLPALVGKFGPWGIVAWVGLRVIRRVLEAWIEKKLSGGDLKPVLEEIRDALKKGLLYEDGAKAILDTAFLYLDDGQKRAFIEDIKALLENMEAVEGVLEYGKNAVWTKTKVVHH